MNIGILEVPPVFTKTWNEQRGYEFADLCTDHDIHKQGRELNECIRNYNKILGYTSPKFENDFEISRRKKEKDKSGGTKSYEVHLYRHIAERRCSPNQHSSTEVVAPYHQHNPM